MRFFRDRNTGLVYTSTALPYSFWKRYLSVFDGVTVVARVKEADHAPAETICASGPGVRFVDLPPYLGARAYVANAARLRARIRAALAPPGAVILRVPSQIGTLAFAQLRKLNRPFGLEVIGDPWEGFGPDASDHPLRAVFRRWFTSQLRQQCRAAACVAYVTQSALQRRFPASPDAFQSGFSDIELPEDAFVDRPRAVLDWSHRIVTVTSLEQPYKGIDLLLQALARLGDTVSLTVVGGGRLRPTYERIAADLKIAGRVRFTGAVPSGDPVRAYLDDADLFVLPSRTEGLPRALVEAMARGLPCVGTDVGGIPELLEAESLAHPTAIALADRICGYFASPTRMSAAAARNLAKAREYSEPQLRPKREAFYRAVATAAGLD